MDIDFKNNKVLGVLLSTTLLTSSLLTVVPGSSAFAKKDTETTQQIEKESDLQKALRQDKVSNDEMMAYGNLVKEEVAKTPTQRIKLAAVKKAIKFAANHTDIIPSSKVRKVVDKYAKKIIKATDYITVATQVNIMKAFMKAGIPAKYADMIADFVVTFLL